jgi:hypothetical protein
MNAGIHMTDEMVVLIKKITKLYTVKKENKEKELDIVTTILDGVQKELTALELRDRYFYNNLSTDINFEKQAEFQVFLKCLPELAMRYKRIFVFINTLRVFFEKNAIQDKYRIDTKSLTKISKCYVDDLSILKKRYNSNVVQLPKIAGLMTNLIVKHRPIIPIDVAINPAVYINEMFAIYHALCICSDFSDGKELIDFEQKPACHEFKSDMKYLLNRNFTAENLIMVFKVLCLYQFPSFLNKDVDG